MAKKTIHDLEQDSRYPFDIFKVGDGVTHNMYSDCQAGTIVKVSPNGRRVWVQRDIATLDKDFKPEIISGGFSGHCTNQSEQSYTFKRDPKASCQVFSLRKWRGRYVWSYSHVDGHMQLSAGRFEFYDYNF